MSYNFNSDPLRSFKELKRQDEEFRKNMDEGFITVPAYGEGKSPAELMERQIEATEKVIPELRVIAEQAESQSRSARDIAVSARNMANSSNQTAESSKILADDAKRKASQSDVKSLIAIIISAIAVVIEYLANHEVINAFIASLFNK